MISIIQEGKKEGDWTEKIPGKIPSNLYRPIPALYYNFACVVKEIKCGKDKNVCFRKSPM